MAAAEFRGEFISPRLRDEPPLGPRDSRNYLFADYLISRGFSAALFSRGREFATARMTRLKEKIGLTALSPLTEA